MKVKNTKVYFILRRLDSFFKSEQGENYGGWLNLCPEKGQYYLESLPSSAHLKTQLSATYKAIPKAWCLKV